MISIASIKSRQDGVGFTGEEPFHFRNVETLTEGSKLSTAVCVYLSPDVSFNQPGP